MKCRNCGDLTDHPSAYGYCPACWDLSRKAPTSRSADILLRGRREMVAERKAEQTEAGSRALGVAPDMTLPTDSAERKEYPLHAGLLAYFPAALAGVARHSKLGNDKHNPGEPLHHARGKSMDHEDCILRHLVDLSDLLARRERMVFTPRGEREMAEQILTEANALAWRALALAQRLHEQIGGAPLAPGAVED